MGESSANSNKLRSIDPEIEKCKFNDENRETHTSIEQIQVEKSVESCFRLVKQIADIDPGCPLLEREEHVHFLKKGLINLPTALEILDASRPWICYWILHSLELLNEPISEDLKSQVAQFLHACQHPDGGFGGGPGQEAHLAPTYAAISALCILRTSEAYEVINREKLIGFLYRLRNADGSFSMHYSSEADIRGAYCALVVARLTNLWVHDLVENTANWISRCQTYEGGFGGVPYMEAHGGYTFCGFASLVLLGKENMCNINSLLRWLANRQMRYEGGFQGRTNKLVDSCYSYWQGGTFPLLHRLLCVTERDTMSTDRWLFNQRALQEYLLICCQATHGGMIDKPGKNKDYYHTCYALSGLSIAQHFAGGNIGRTLIVGDPENELCPTHPIYNIGIDAAVQASQYFRTLPVLSVSSFKEKTEETD